MELTELIFAARGDLAHFNYAEYPGRFAAFAEQAGPAFAALAGQDADVSAARLIDALEERLLALPRRERRACAFALKQVLAYFLGPAARRAGGEALAFAESLCRQWNARYPRNPFLLGDYETLMQGFDTNLLGLHLRKPR